MKKILGIVVLSLLWGNFSYAGCKDDIDMSWKQPNPYTPVVGFINVKVIYFVFVNNNNKDISITAVRMLTADNQIIKTHVPVPAAQTLKSFGKLIAGISLKGVNQKVWKLSDYSCSYK